MPRPGNNPLVELKGLAGPGASQPCSSLRHSALTVALFETTGPKGKKLEADAPGADESRGLRRRISGQAEDAIGKLADDLLSNEVINNALQHAFGAREKVAQAQESAMEALNIPSASNVDKLARRLRSISQRLEEIEDGVERVDRRLDGLDSATKHPAAIEERLGRIESQLDDLGRELAALRREAGSADAATSAATRAIVPEG
jgi:chromosome segregation ATPase